MKKLIYLIFLFLPVIGIGQNYFHFPDSNAIWREYYWEQSGDNHYQYGIIGDTVINSVTYHKIYYQSQCLLDTNLTINNSVLMGGIREDSLRRVFFYSMGNYPNGAYFVHADSIYKLYDFSVQIGDTIKFDTTFPPLPYAYQYIILDSIDSIFAYNNFRKRYHFNADIWIEGIGSTHSLFSSIIPLTTCICYRENVCFEYNNITYYLNPPYLDCYDMTENVSHNKPNDNRIFIYPNPVLSVGTIDFSSIENKIERIEVYNVIGKKIKNYNVPINKKIIIAKSEFDSGLYIIRLISADNKNYFGKLLIE